MNPSGRVPPLAALYGPLIPAVGALLIVASLLMVDIFRPWTMVISYATGVGIIVLDDAVSNATRNNIYELNKRGYSTLMVVATMAFNLLASDANVWVIVSLLCPGFEFRWTWDLVAKVRSRIRIACSTRIGWGFRNCGCCGRGADGMAPVRVCMCVCVCAGLVQFGGERSYVHGGPPLAAQSLAAPARHASCVSKVRKDRVSLPAAAPIPTPAPAPAPAVKSDLRGCHGCDRLPVPQPILEHQPAVPPRGSGA